MSYKSVLVFRRKQKYAVRQVQRCARGGGRRFFSPWCWSVPKYIWWRQLTFGKTLYESSISIITSSVINHPCLVVEKKLEKRQTFKTLRLVYFLYEKKKKTDFLAMSHEILICKRKKERQTLSTAVSYKTGGGYDENRYILW